MCVCIGTGQSAAKAEWEVRQLIVLHGDSTFVCMCKECYRIANVFPVCCSVVQWSQRKESVHYNGVACRETEAIREAMCTATQK